MYTFFAKSASYAVDDIGWSCGAGEMIIGLDGSPEFRHVLHCACAHLKVPVCSFVRNALLTRKLLMLWSPLIEINEGCEKILPVSGSFWSNFNHNTKFFNLSSEEKAALENLSKRRDIIVKVANKDGAWLFCGPTSTKKKLCYNFLTLLFMPKSIKISLPLTNKLSRALLTTL